MRAFIKKVKGRWLPLLAGLVATTLTSSTPVHASCGVTAPPGSVADAVAEARVVFVGRVVYTSDGDRFARVKVESIWKGPVLPAYVDVHGEAPGSGPFSGSEGDHRYQAGARYLFIPSNDQPPFQDYGDCNISTQVYSGPLSALAPSDARAPNPPTTSDTISNFSDEFGWPLAVGASLIVAIIATALVKRRRRARVT
jgi:hypothetical protein